MSRVLGQSEVLNSDCSEHEWAAKKSVYSLCVRLQPSLLESA